MLTSKDGVLEVRLTARQGQATLDTVATPVQNFLLFDYEVIRGTASNGQRSGGNLYPAPTLQVFPGERLIVHFENGLTGLTIRDYFIPQYTAKGQPVPIYPEQMTVVTDKSSHPWSSHQSEGKCRQCHAAHPAGDVEHLHLRHSSEHAAGAVLVSLSSSWAHCGAGLHGSRRSACDRTNRRQPAARDGEEHSDPQHGAAVQFRLRSCGWSGAAQQSELAAVGQHDHRRRRATSWRTAPTALCSRRSTSTSPKPGTKYFTVWYAGPLSINNHRGHARVHPQQSPAIHRGGRQSRTAMCRPIRRCRIIKRDVQFTVNGQFQPVIKSKAGQTEIWVLANVSDIAYINVQLTETATGRHPHDRHCRPGRQSLSGRSLSAAPTMAPGCSFRRRAASRLP